MKRYLLTIAVALMGCFLFAGCDDNDDDNMDVAVTKEYTEALLAMYPSAKVTEWDSYAPYYVALCVIDGNETDVWFGPNAAVWAMTETDLGMSPLVLPEAVQQAFNATEYAYAAIQDIEKFERTDLTFYVIECDLNSGTNVDVYITEDGTVAQAIPATGSVIYPTTPIGL